jgi:hypothetical protein
MKNDDNFQMDEAEFVKMAKQLNTWAKHFKFIFPNEKMENDVSQMLDKMNLSKEKNLRILSRRVVWLFI